MKKAVFLLLIFSYFLSSGKSIENILMDLQNGEISESINALLNLSKQNDIIAQFYTGECYNYGLGLSKNDRKAYEMYRKAAERGLPEAMIKLSSLYKTGRGIERDTKKAQEWENRYKERGRSINLPDICELYKTGVRNQEKKIEGQANHYYSNASQPNTPYNNNLSNVNNDHTGIENKMDELPISTYDDLVPQPLNNKTYAIVIANEHYKYIPDVPYAVNDGEVVRKYLTTYLAVPKSNIQYLEDASLNDIKYALSNISERCKAFQEEISVIIYYAGHGVPDNKTAEAFLLPVDGFGTDPSSGLNLDDFYTFLSAMPAKSVIVLLDACFSGTKRDGGMLMATRGITIKPKMQVPDGKLIVLSATSNDETAFPIEQQKHGLFTYTILRKIQETGGDITWGELADHVIETVKNRSIDLNGKLQTPTVSVSPFMKDIWKDIKLK